MRTGQAAGRTVLCPYPVPDPAVRVFLLHHAGGSHLLFRDWPRHFPSDWEVCLMEAPGRGRLADEPPVAQVEDLLPRLRADMLPLLDRPYVLFGHSMGALVAHQLAARLIEYGDPAPRWLGVSARAAPRPDGGLDMRTRHLLPDEELRASIAEMGGTPREVLADPEWWAYLAPLLRADLRLVETWRPRPGAGRLPVPVTAFGGDRDVVVRPHRLADWREHTTRFLGLHLYPGDHFYLQSRIPAFVARLVADARLAIGGGG
ncbi:thioesterase II family protein [Couchioplanes azureus]|uniref:thioesterase II family protein n=1 Tax=Couchioplanes caeruleus TaxID=56438 RepID=UPI00167103F5|nr:alpha/beta fold hydrolase [Couchioplanes caeruleus]GGQ76251.1 thioesterase [Couchioplanes caeruleus subsp. azureus]